MLRDSNKIMTTLITHTLDEFTFRNAEARYEHQGVAWSTEELTALVNFIKANDTDWIALPMPMDQDGGFRIRMTDNIVSQFQQQYPSKTPTDIVTMVWFILQNVPLYTGS